MADVSKLQAEPRQTNYEIKNEKFLNRGRWAALVVRLGIANEREKS